METSFYHQPGAQHRLGRKRRPNTPICGGRMIVIEVFERGMQPHYWPPSAAAIWFDTS